MKKNITTLLQKGNLTAKERYLLLIQNDVIRDTKGKEPLTEADKKALENWQAKTNIEAREWNKYNEAFKLFGRAGLEAEMMYQDARAEHFRKNFINLELSFYPLYRKASQLIKRLETIKRVSIKEAIEITNKQREQKLKDGIDFDYAVYRLAYESLSDKDNKELNELMQEVEYDTSFLDEQEIIANLCKEGLTDQQEKETKEKLAELVAERSYNKFAQEYQLYHYFACIPLAEVARKFLASKGVKIKGKRLNENQEADDEDDKTHAEIQKVIEDYARDNKLTIETILKETCLKWLEETDEDKNLFSEYTPLCFHKDTAELWDNWLKAKAEARAKLQGFIDKGELKVRERTADETRQDRLYSRGLYYTELEKAKRVLEVSKLYGDLTAGLETTESGSEAFSDRVITGESLYNFKCDYKFVKEFKGRADDYEANMGIVYADDDPDHKGDPIDLDLLITNKDFFSSYDLTVSQLKATYEATHFLKETFKDGEITLDFNSDELKKIFKEIRDSLIACYAKLLAHKEVVKRLSKVYEIDLTYILNNRLEAMSDFISQHNDALSKATGQDKDGYKEQLITLEGESIKRKRVLKMKDDLFIDRDKILPDINTQESWSKKFEEILGEEF